MVFIVYMYKIDIFYSRQDIKAMKLLHYKRSLMRVQILKLIKGLEVGENVCCKMSLHGQIQVKQIKV